MSDSDFTSKTLRDKTKEKLLESLEFLKKELFNLRFQVSIGELVNASRFAKVRKDIARIKTELTRRAKSV